MSRTFVSLALAASLVAPSLAVAIPDTAYATSATTNVAAVEPSEIQEAKELLNKLDAAVNTLEAAQAEDVEVPWTKEFRKLFSVSSELRQTLDVISTGGITLLSPSLTFARVDLFIETVLTLVDAQENLSNKVQSAQVEMGFAVTRAVLRLVNPGATVAQLNDSVADLQATLAKVSTYRDLQDTDQATIYIKHNLVKAIWDTRIQRDKNILGKKPFAVYNTLNKSITKAVGVRLDPKATVAEVNQAIASLETAYATALAAADK